MSDAIERHGIVAITPGSWSEAQAMATKLADAKGFVPRVMEKDPNAVLAAILTGAELGIGPMQSLRSIHVIEGRPMLSADLMLALAIRGGVKPQWLETTASVARLKLVRAGFEPHEHTFTIAEAKAAGLVGKQNWQRYAPAMLRARCLSAGLRAFCPDVLGAGVYVEGELEDDDAPLAASEPEPRQLPAPTAAPRMRLGECGDELTLREWLAEHGARVAADAGLVGRVVAHAEKIGLSAEDVRGWLGTVAA